MATVILENPIDSGNVLTHAQLCEEVRDVFGITSSIKLYEKENEISSKNFVSVAGKTLTTDLAKDQKFAGISGALCPFVDVEYKEKKATLLMENPLGCRVTDYLNEVLSSLFTLPVGSAKKFKNAGDVMDLTNMTPKRWDGLNGKTVKLVM